MIRSSLQAYPEQWASMLRHHDRAFLFCSASFLLIIFAGTDAHCQQQDLQVSHAATLQQRPGYESLFSKVDLGKLPAGQRVLINLAVSNSEDRLISFNPDSKNCKCLSFAAETDNFPANGITNFKIGIRVLDRHKSAKVVMPLTLKGFKETDGIVAVFNIFYEIEGLLSIPRQMWDLELAPDEKIGELLVPVMLTDPIKVENLTIKKRPTLRDLGAKVHKNDKGVFVQVTAPRMAISDGPIGGEIVVTDKVTGRSDQFYLTCRTESPIRISPKVLRFRKAKNSDELIANVVISIKKPAASSSTDVQDANQTETAQSSLPVKIGSSWSNRKLRLETTQMGQSSFYRVKVFLTPTKEEQLILASQEDDVEVPPVEWTIFDGRTTQKEFTEMLTVR